VTRRAVDLYPITPADWYPTEDAHTPSIECEHRRGCFFSEPRSFNLKHGSAVSYHGNVGVPPTFSFSYVGLCLLELYECGTAKTNLFFELKDRLTRSNSSL
jgi:hypothetical protein